MIRKYIPDFITSLNLLSGVVGVCFVFRDRFDIAFLLMLAAAVFDFLDGFSARMLDAYSSMGKELDSLSDVVSFGVLPSVMLVRMMQICTFSPYSVICHVPLLIAVFSGLRLAKFNVDARQKDSFIGLPTPACAMICGSLCYFLVKNPDSFLSAWAAGYVFIPLLSAALSVLLVSGIPMFSMKMGRGVSNGGNEVKKRLFFLADLAIIALLSLTLSLDWSLIILLGFTVYILLNVAFAIVKV